MQITAVLMEWTGLSLEEIKKHLQWNDQTGPTIYIQQLDDICDTCNEYT